MPPSSDLFGARASGPDRVRPVAPREPPGRWSVKRVLIVVRTYPVPAHRGVEVSCTAGITSNGEWIRLFPVPYRFLAPTQRFNKYQWIDVQVTRARSDPRPESFNLRIDSIQRHETIGTERNWHARRNIVNPLKRGSLCEIAAARREGGPTLGIFKPGRINRLRITAAKPPTWTSQELTLLRQQQLGFETAPRQMLEKIPLEFRYEFHCVDPACRGHRMMCTDWEMGESYRRWHHQYGDKWEAAFRQRYEREMIDKNDTHFYVGTVHQHPDEWLIVGLFYPPRPASADLFDSLV
jgi:hypothetical protein